MQRGVSMNIFINIICALGGAIFGSWIGHRFTIKLYKEKALNQKEALSKEVYLIHDDFISWLKILIDEFGSPLRESYSGPPFIYTQLIENLIVELSGTHQIVSLDQRNLLIGLKRKNEELLEKDGKRDKYANRWLLKSAELNKVEKLRTKQGVKFWTAHLLSEVIDIVFHTSKFIEEKDNFMFKEYGLEVKINIVCQYSGIDYNPEFWSEVTKLLNA